jgi:hypothetical protein
MKRTLTSLARFGLLACLGHAGCGDGGAAGGAEGADAGRPVSFDLPTAVSRGGPVLAAPRIQAIYFPGFAQQPAIDGFLASLARSRYWTETTAEYGVGRPTVLPSDASAVAVPAAIGVADIPGLFARALADHQATLGLPRGDTIYTLFFPSGTQIDGGGFTLCAPDAPSGFHGELTVAQARVPVIVIPACATFAGHSELTGAAALTPALSHELIEAATDPFPSSAPAFLDTDDQHAMWALALHGGEIADLCENEAPNLLTPDDLGYPVQRSWSNVAARGTGGPCVPVPPGEIYFNAVARLPDKVEFQRNGAVTTFLLPALRAPLGGSADVTLDFRSADPAQAWRAVAIELQSEASLGPNAMGMHAPSVPGSTGDAKTITVWNQATPAAGEFPLLVLSHADSGALHVWVGAITRR